MKILAYSDVHGNIDALNELQKTADYCNADLRVFLGDAVMMCPYPNECLESIWKSGDVFILGNHDSYCAYGLPDEEKIFFKTDKKAHQAYMRNKVKKEYIEKLKTMPKEFSVEVDGIKLYFAHYAWETESYLYDDPDNQNPATEKTGELFNDVKADYVFFGHNHKPADFIYNGKHFVCVGTLGMKFPGNYVVIDIEKGNVKIERKKIYFDVNKLKQEMLKENYSRAEDYAKWFNEELL